MNFDNFCPIGLLSIAYRIISKAISNRIQQALQKIIGPHQFAYLHGRRAENISRIVSEIVAFLLLPLAKGIVQKVQK